MRLLGITVSLILLSMVGMAQATLVTIGTATYYGSDYNLIWDDDNNGNSVVWLDYTRWHTEWEQGVNWAADLDNFLTYNIDRPYHVHWQEDNWRLPVAVDGPYIWGYDGTTTAGYNITTSEFGHLYYDELNNLGLYDIYGNELETPIDNTGDFENLINSHYWTGTRTYIDSYDRAWGFQTAKGAQYAGAINPTSADSVIAIRTARITPNPHGHGPAPVPEPSTILLLGSGLAGLAFYRRKRK